MMINATRLEPKDEMKLARLARAGEEKARDLLVTSNLPLVMHIAKHFKGPLDLDDKIQEGVTGLIHATKTFKPEKGVRFGTYASWWIRQAISRAIASQSRDIRLPVQMHVRLRKIEREAQAMFRKLGRAPTTEEIGGRLGLPARKIGLLEDAGQRPVSLSQMRPDSDGGVKVSRAEAERAQWRLPEAIVQREELKASLASCMESLRPRERYVLQRRYGLDDTETSTLEDIAHDMGISRERVRQIAKQALHKIEVGPCGDSLREFYRN